MSLKIYKNTPHSDKYKEICFNRIREVHCFNCKYPPDTDQNFTEEGKHPGKTRYTLAKFPKNTEITRLMTFSHILWEQ